jgi:hypothetical protein
MIRWFMASKPTPDVPAEVRRRCNVCRKYVNDFDRMYRGCCPHCGALANATILPTFRESGKWDAGEWKPIKSDDPGAE